MAARITKIQKGIAHNHPKREDGQLVGGNGCIDHPLDCFTCPYPPDDCRYERYKKKHACRGSKE